MADQTAFIHSTVIRPGVLVTGMNFYARVRWATDLGILAVPPTRPPTPAEYYESPEQFIADATDASPFEFDPDVLWWQALRDTHRVLYAMLEWRPDQTSAWKLYSQITFIINHDPIANAGIDQEIVTVDINGILKSDVTLDASGSDDEDLHATTNADPGPLHYKWTLAGPPIFVNPNGPAFSAASNVAAVAKPIVFARGTQFDYDDRGLYTFEVEVSDNDIATQGKDAGKPGKGRAITRVLVTSGALVDIWIESFIPQKTITNPAPSVPPWNYFAFAGDDRMDAQGNAIFAKGSPRQRMWTSVVLDLDTTNPIQHQDHDTGITTGYTISGLSWMGGTLQPVLGKRTGKASTKGMFESALKTGSTVRLTIDGKAADPLIPAPPTLLHFDIWLSTDQGKLTYTMSGYHDYFPACEMYIGSNLVYSYDCKGESPWQMMKPSGVLGGSVGKTVAIGPSVIDLKTAFANPVWREGSGELCYFPKDFRSQTG